MTLVPKSNPQEYCRNLLLAEKRDREDRGILPSECAIIDILLARDLEMAAVYDELCARLFGNEQGIRAILSMIVSSAAFWHPLQLKEVRERKKELREKNEKIAKLASELASVITQRSNLHETSRLLSDTTDDICEVIERASRNNPLFHSWLEKPLRNLGSQFDTKYWPSLATIIMEISRDAEGAGIDATDELTAAALVSERPSNADFLRAFYQGFDSDSLTNGGFLPDGFRLTDRSMASLMSCALNLDPDQPIEAQYVKRVRQRDRLRFCTIETAGL